MFIFVTAAEFVKANCLFFRSLCILSVMWIVCNLLAVVHSLSLCHAMLVQFKCHGDHLFLNNHYSMIILFSQSVLFKSVFVLGHLLHIELMQ